VCDWFDAGRHGDFDLVVIPLGFIGDRDRYYRQPPASPRGQDQGPEVSQKRARSER